MSMLSLEDRIGVAFNNDLGIQLSSNEVKLLAKAMLYVKQGKPNNAVSALKELFK